MYNRLSCFSNLCGTYCRKAGRTRIRSAIAGVTLCLSVACSAPSSTIEIIDLSQTGSPTPYREHFEEGYFDIDARGNLDIVLTRREPSPLGSGHDLTQIVHVRCIWNSIPGQTVAEGTQINSCVTYAIIDGDAGSSFDGTGATFIDLDRKDEELNGSLEHALLKPRRHSAGRGFLFERVDLSGRFHAKRNRQRVAELVNEVHRRFGPVAIHSSTPRARAAP